jgi:hypothetical protein
MGGGALKGRRSLDAILAQAVAVKLSKQLAARCASQSALISHPDDSQPCPRRLFQDPCSK